MNDKFHLEINSFGDFIKFVAIIREKEIDFEKIHKLTEQINQIDSSLEKAIESQGEKNG